MSWQLASFAVLFAALLGGFLWYERSRPPAKVLALAAALAALAVVGRIAFAPIPNVKPTTDIVLFSGYALGGPAGFAVGAVTALASNAFFLQGPWTPWQMAAWGAVGTAGGALRRLLGDRELGRFALAFFCGVAGLGFGLVMDAFVWTLAAEQTLASFLAVSTRSLSFNVAHIVGNVAFCLLLGPPFVRALRRYRRRFEVRWHPPRPAQATPSPAVPLASLVLVALGFLTLGAPPPAEASSASTRAARYLERAQNTDGGFGGAPRQASSQLFTGWAGLGLASAGRNPRDVRRGRRSLIDYVRSNARSLGDTGELERTILVLRASGLSPRRFAGRDLTGQLRRRRDDDGSFGGRLNLTAFGIMAMRASGGGVRSLRRPARWLAGQQNRDGGFGFVPRAPSDVDVTGAALEALAAAGRRRDGAVRRAVGYLQRVQHPDGGFGTRAQSPSNAQSTAWAVQGLVAVRRNPDRLRHGGRTPLRYLRSLQMANGSIRYSRGSAQTPVWVTAQALTALRRKAFPLAPVPRRRPARSRGKAADGGGVPTRGERLERKADGDRQGNEGALEPGAPAAPSRPSGLAPGPILQGVGAKRRDTGRRRERYAPRRPWRSRPARGRPRARRRRAVPLGLLDGREEEDD